MKKYELNSEMLKDILEKVPTDKVEVLMKELTALVMHCKLTMDAGELLAGEVGEAVLRNPLIWKDDGKGEIEVSHSINEIEIMTTKEIVK